MADLDVRMAEIKAGSSTAAPVQGVDRTPPPQGRPADPVQGDAPEADDGPPDPTDTADKPKPGGRFERIRAQLTAAEEKARTLEGQHQQREAQYAHALRQFVDLVLPDAQLEQLRMQAEAGDWEAKQRVDLARQWRRMVAPIADLAERAHQQQFNQDLASLRTLDGMDADSHQRLLNAQTPGEKLKLMHDVAYKAATAEHKERIAALEAEVQSLKTNRAANGQQPASGGGRSVNGSGVLAGWLGSDGLPTEEAISRARQGGFRDLATH
jgi:hypothetical protein